jgi:S-DNA-T family DNA segregation ATPase FtsK/SpoIIIE
MAQSKRKPAARPRTRPKTPTRVKQRRRRKTRSQVHHLELVGLGLVALGVFFACVLWLGLNGGPVTSAVRSGIGWAAYVLPLVLCPVGTLVLTRSELVSRGPFRLGGALGLLGLMAALGRAHGGFVGRELEALVGRGVGSTGTTILGVLVALIGVLLLTGASLGALIRRSGGAVQTVSTRVRREMAQARPPSRIRLQDEPLSFSDSDSYSSLERPAAPVDGVQSFPDLVAVSPPAAERAPLEPLPPPLPLISTGFPPAAEEEETNPSLFDGGPPPSEYRLPDRALLRTSDPKSGPSGEANRRVAEALLRCLASFGVEATVVGTISGPRVTRYELQLAPGIKVGKVAQLRDDLSYALATTEIRILAPIPGKQAVGVEVPNLSPNLVTLGDIYNEIPAPASPLAVWLGKGIDGQAVYSDLARMPHLLIAGTTGSGKSGCINAILTSILLRSTPDQVRMILVDPKRIELNYYESIPHLLTPVVSSPKEASAVLLNVVTEMERRYERLSVVRARGLPEANRAFRKRGEPELPYLLVVIDELADLMMVSPQDVEDAIIRLAQKSRAVGSTSSPE